MDLSNLDTRNTAEAGISVHLRHPFYAHLMFYGTPGNDVVDRHGALLDGITADDPRVRKVTMTVRGFNSASVKKLLRSQSRRRIAAGKMAPREEQQLNEQFGHELMDIVVLAWDGFFLHGAPLECNIANKIDLFDRAPDLWKQASEAAGAQERYLGERESD